MNEGAREQNSNGCLDLGRASLLPDDNHVLPGGKIWRESASCIRDSLGRRSSGIVDPRSPSLQTEVGPDDDTGAQKSIGSR